MTTVKISVVFFLHATVSVYQIQNITYSNNRDMVDFLQAYHKKITNDVHEFYCSPLFLLTLREILILGLFLGISTLK